MRTRRFYKYLMAMIIALGTTANVFAQERALKIYFNENSDTATGPRILVKDDNGNYELPIGLKVTLGGAVWADKARFWEMFQRDVSDRVIAAYTASDKKESKLTLSFVDKNGKSTMPYEVNSIQWNVMNDLLSSSILDLLDNYRITTKCIPANGTGWSSTDEKWDMNFFAKNITFTQKDVPWKSGAVLNGLTSFEIGEQCWRKSPLGWLINHQVELDDKCRTFIKAGWNGSNTNSNITDSDDSNWAFKVKFTLPDIDVRCYNTATNNVDNNIIVTEAEGTHKLQGYISAHPGAVQVTTDPSDPDRFHYEYFVLNGNKVTIDQYNGLITVNESGTVQVEVKLMRGNREVTSKIATINVSAVDPNAPKIAIAFANGNKGYDITVGDDNAQIRGIITQRAKDKNGKEYDITPKVGYQANDYYFQYSADNDNIITIDKYTGKITAKNEGDVHVSAILKYGSDVKSETYTYTLHVFAQHEGLEFRRINTYHYSNSENYDHTGWGQYPERTTWNVGTTSSDANYDWKSNNLLRVNTSINGAGSNYGVNDWKQIASFSTGEFEYWRAICQEIAFDVYVPKYTKSVTQYSFAGNAAIGSKKTHQTDEWVSTGLFSGYYKMSTGDCKYGFEINYLNQKWVNGNPVNEQISLEQANTKLQNRNWNTYNTGSISQTFARNGAANYISDISASNAINREIDNVTSANSNQHRTFTVYFATMAYLWNDEGYPGNVSIGFKGIPEYTYYTTVTYNYQNNDGTYVVWDTEEFSSTSKTETKKMLQNKDLPTRAGYTLVGWSTDPDPKTATVEYDKKGDFCPYDNVNGGGKGPVNLYAVWRAISYTVTLNHNYHPYNTEEITAVYGQPMPESAELVAPTWKGHDFTGYRQGTYADPTIFYYDANMKSVRNYDQPTNYTLYANWVDHTTKVVFDPQGGNNSGVTQVTATYGQAMPTNGVSVPAKTGYTFEGYYTGVNGTGTQYYTASMTSAKNWDIDERTLNPQVTEVTLYAKWTAKNYTVTLNHNYHPYNTEEVTAVYGQPMPEGADIVAPTRKGYDFTGYRTQKDVTPRVFYYDANMKSVHNYDQNGDYTLFANWVEHTTEVVFDPQGGNNSGATQVTATYGQAMPTNGVVAPTRTGYVFEGYYTGVNGTGTQYYTANMASARNWDIDERLLNPQVTEVTLYAKWTKVAFTVTLNADGGRFDGQVGSNGTIIEENVGSLILQVRTGESECSEIWCSNRINIKPGYKLLGWYTERQTESDVNHHPALHPGTLVYSVPSGNNFSYHFSAVPETGSNPKYWNSGTKWVGTDDLTLYAHYEIIFEVEDDVITFTDMTPKNYVLGEDLTAALDYAKEHNVAMVNTIDMRYPDTGENGKNGESIMKAFEDAKEETNSIVSPNALILFTNTWPQQRTTNAVTLNGNGGICQNLVVTDRYSMRIPVKFQAQHASYARDAKVTATDPAKEQAQNSTWGTLCLPYPIKNNTNGVKFYELKSMTNNYMEFSEMAQGVVIDANTPVLYNRTDGGVSSMITIVENYIDVPMNADYTPVIKSYSDADASIHDWEFRGNLKTTVFYGKGYENVPENSQILKGDVYYFKQNKFTYLNPAMDKNGKHYNAGMMTLYPYRAYFYRKDTGGNYYSSAKVSEYSILVIGEDGTTLDITNTILDDGEGDGKIYDLNGIRVMQPVKGRLYIVNGQKKVYR